MQNSSQSSSKVDYTLEHSSHVTEIFPWKEIVMAVVDSRNTLTFDDPEENYTNHEVEVIFELI